MTATSFFYVKILVHDAVALGRFYCDVLGLKEVRRYDKPEGENPLMEIFLSAGPEEGGSQLVLMQYLNRPVPAPGEAALAFMVDDVDTTTAAVDAAGGAITMPPETLEEYNFRIATITDPEGHSVELMQFLG